MSSAGRSVGYDWTYKFDEKWKITNRFHYVDERRQRSIGFDTYGGFDGTTITRAFYDESQLQRRSLSTNLDLTGEIETGPDHAISPSSASTGSRRERNSNGFGQLRLSAQHLCAGLWQSSTRSSLHDSYITGVATCSWRATSRDFGVYAQDQMSLLRRSHASAARRTLGQGRRRLAARPMATAGASCFPFCTGFPLQHLSGRAEAVAARRRAVQGHGRSVGLWQLCPLLRRRTMASRETARAFRRRRACNGKSASRNYGSTAG